jgi:hypothetical protein
LNIQTLSDVVWVVPKEDYLWLPERRLTDHLHRCVQTPTMLSHCFSTTGSIADCDYLELQDVVDESVRSSWTECCAQHHQTWSGL